MTSIYSSISIETERIMDFTGYEIITFYVLNPNFRFFVYEITKILPKKKYCQI